jgi:predicted homoserine dehydrogenase-like protein
MARALIDGVPTGDWRALGPAGEADRGPTAELVTVAKKDLKPGDELDGGGGYTVYGLSERADVARRENLLPFGFAYEGSRVKRPVTIDQALTWDDVDVDRSGFLYELRQEQDRLFATPAPAASR